jgi:hypothetical protein
MTNDTATRFDALDFKRQSQEHVQQMLEDLSPDEEIQVLAKAVAEGPFREEWHEPSAGDVGPEPATRRGKRRAVAGTR